MSSFISIYKAFLRHHLNHSDIIFDQVYKTIFIKNVVHSK